MQLAVHLQNDGRRDALDLALYAELRVTHPATIDGVTRTVVRLPLNSPWVPRVRIRHEARIRVAVEEIPDSDWKRLRARVGVEHRDLAAVLKSSADSTVRFYVLAYDAFSGARQIFVAEYDKSSFTTLEASQHASDEDWAGSEREFRQKSAHAN
jgi:hypothetical protein